MTDKNIFCDSCNSKALKPVPGDTSNVENWKCTKCGNSKTVCPRCDGNGWVYHVKLKSDETEIWLCDECDALWLSREDIGLHSFQDFSTWMESEKGLPGTWDQIDIVPSDNEI